MDFFEAQALAKKRTSRLIVLFVLAVAGTVVAGYFATIGIQLAMSAKGMISPRGLGELSTWWQPGAAFGVAVLTVLIIGIASGGKWLSFREGGSAVARMLGGRRVNPATTDFQERQLLNVVEEMAIASGVGVPATYVLPEESAINAFAAGLTTSDAVVAVTRGTMETLTRDELQGVVAHEFSHILNGDMRLNLKLASVLFGILAIALIGQGILRSLRFAAYSSGRNRKGGGGGIILVWIAAGLAALIIGYIGYFFGRLIQAAVSRQREYLADASAVQFTRNPEGIAGALKKIGGQSAPPTLQSTKAAQINHCFFTQNFRSSFGGGFATHPPLAERIRAIDPHFDGKFVRPQPVEPPKQQQPPPVPARASRPPPPLGGRSLPVDATVLLGAIGLLTESGVDRAQQLLADLPDELRNAARAPDSARCLIFALLADRDATTRDQQLAQLTDADAAATRELADKIATEPLEVRLPLAQLAFPALRELDASAHTAFLQTLDRLAHADNVVTPFEFALRRIVTHGLEVARTPTRLGDAIYSFAALSREVQTVLSTLAHAGAEAEGDATQAFAQGAAQLPVLKNLALTPANDIDLDQLDAALNRLAQAAPPIKQRVIAGACAVIAADGAARLSEIELLRAVCAALDCPMPPVAVTGR